MSGDNPATKRWEAWNPLFSRWPIWSELYLYSLASESYIGYWSNMNGPLLNYRIDLFRNYSFDFAYYFWFSQYNPDLNNNIIGTGRNRGNDLQLWFKWNLFNNSLKGHLLIEYFITGDFYKKRSVGYFTRFEINYLY